MLLTARLLRRRQQRPTRHTFYAASAYSLLALFIHSAIAAPETAPPNAVPPAIPSTTLDSATNSTPSTAPIEVITLPAAPKIVGRLWHNARELPVQSLAWSSDGQWLASGSWDRKIAVWKAADRSIGWVITTPGEETVALAWGQTPARETDNAKAKKTTQTLLGPLFSAGGEALWRGWDVATETSRVLGRGHVEAVSSLALSPDGKTVATGGWDGTVRLWSEAGGQPLQTWTGHRAVVSGLAWSPDGQTLLSCSWDGTLRLWNLQTAMLKREVVVGENWLQSVAWSPDGTTFAAGDWNGAVRWWKASTVEAQSTFDSGARVSTVAWSPDNRFFASAGWDGQVTLRDGHSGTEIGKIAVAQPIESLAWSPLPKPAKPRTDQSTLAPLTLAIGSAHGAIELWRVF